MKQSTMKWAMLLVVFATLALTSACKKKVAPPPPDEPPPPPAPTATLTANPNVVQQGQPVTLTWNTENATSVNIEGVGTVQSSGSQQVTPTASTTYRLVARGDGGTKEATARVTVNAPPPPPVQKSATDRELFQQNVKDVFFDYDSFDIRADAQSAISANAAFLKQHPNIRFTVEGHADERGSTEYNLALGDSRANAVKQALIAAGVSADRINTISFGKEKPFCNEQNEGCWQQNRRGHFTMQE